MTIPNIIDMQEVGAKSDRQWKKSKPVYIRKLVARFSKIDEAAEKIGLTGNAMSRYLKEDEATFAMELAAQFIYERDFPEGGGQPKNKPVAAIVQGDLHHVKTIKDMVEMLGGKFCFIEL